MKITELIVLDRFGLIPKYIKDYWTHQNSSGGLVGIDPIKEELLTRGMLKGLLGFAVIFFIFSILTYSSLLYSMFWIFMLASIVFAATLVGLRISKGKKEFHRDLHNLKKSLRIEWYELFATRTLEDMNKLIHRQVSVLIKELVGYEQNKGRMSEEAREAKEAVVFAYESLNKFGIGPENFDAIFREVETEVLVEKELVH